MSKKKPRPTPVPAERIEHLIDAHTHLASCGARTKDDVDAFVARALDAGVERICTVGDGLEEAELALQAAHTELHDGDIAVADTVVDNQPARGGRSVEDNRELIPFQELMKRLNDEHGDGR